MVKFMLYKKATKIVKIFTVNLTFNVRSEKKNTKHSSNTLLRLVKILSFFVAFLENMNFARSI